MFTAVEPPMAELSVVLDSEKHLISTPANSRVQLVSLHISVRYLGSSL